MGKYAALNGIRVIECSLHLNGPFAGRLLAELGAEVIKVERPDGGDPNRHTPPKFGEDSSYFLNYNSNKKFITLNLKHEKGKEIFLKLIEKSDILLENFRPGVMDRLGLGYEILKEVNPKLIYASSTGYGYTGPYRDEPSYDTLIQAMIGMMDLTGFPCNPPVRCAPSIIDISAGMMTALAILSALYYREKTGKGQRIDIAQYDVGINLMIGLYSELQGGKVKRVGNTIPVLCPYNAFKSKDGWVVIVAQDDERFRKLLQLIGRRDLLEDPRYATNEARVEHCADIDRIVSAWAEQHSTSEIITALKNIDVACAPVRPFEALLDDPQVKARDMLVEVEHPLVGKFKTIGSALKMSETPGYIKTPGLPLGYNNEEVYGEILGMSKEEIDELKRRGVI